MFLARLMGCALALGAPSTASAQECVIGIKELVGMLGKDGSCHGFKKDFALKYLHIEQSQCQPASQKGHLLLGHCVADVPPIQKEADVPNDVRELKAMVIELEGDMDVLREQMAAQYNELMSEIDFLKSRLESPRR
jgi:hypothetical protein